MTTQVIVLGPHRSGTSCVAGILYNLNIFMGYNLLEASESNKKGHFEDKDFLSLNEKFIGGWDNPIADYRRFDKESYKNEIYKRDSQFNLWGVKDPRFCITIFNFYPLLSNPKVINVERSPKFSALSLYKRENFSFRKAEEIIMKYDSYRMNFVKNFVDKNNIININFERLLNEPKKEIDRICDFIEVEPTDKAIEFIAPELVNYRFSQSL